MAYQSLYRKYRPRNLNEVYGQKVVVNILKNAVENNKFGHAYLFTGPRGSGKTSVAKILARMVNCENITDGVPCGECSGCINSISDNCIDILEIDAASNNGVDEIRELKSKINLIPSVLKYKIYIIDEVHMLTESAFNALLKTLEEPPKHVIFILATTEFHKVPITIISRCQTLEFKKINNNDMFERLKEISELEKIKINDNAIWEIVNDSDGGLRDAIGLLDMATSYTNDLITEEDIYTINGNISSDEINYMSELIINKNQNEILKIINDYYDNGKDLLKILEKVIFDLKNKMIEQNDTNICFIIENLTNALNKMKNSSIGKIYLELEIFKLCQSNTLKNEIETKSVNRVEKENSVDNNLKQIRINNTFVEVNKKSLLDYKEKWQKLNDYTFDKECGALVCELLDAMPIAASSKYLILKYNYDSFVEKGNMYIEKYENTLKNTIGVDVKLVFVTNEEWLKIKKEYIENVKNNVKYSYIDEGDSSVKITNSISSNNDKSKIAILEKANELFDSNKIEIKEK